MTPGLSDIDRERFRDTAIRVGTGFVAKEHSFVLESLSALGPHVGKWDPHDVEIDVSLQDRGGSQQRVTLQARLPGLPMLVATADNPDLGHALSEVKREVIRQLKHQKSDQDPMNNRRGRRTTIRHPSAPTHSDAEDLG